MRGHRPIMRPIFVYDKIYLKKGNMMKEAESIKKGKTKGSIVTARVDAKHT